MLTAGLILQNSINCLAAQPLLFHLMNHDSVEPSSSLQPVSHPSVTLASESVSDETSSHNEEIAGTTYY